MLKTSEYTVTAWREVPEDSVWRIQMEDPTSIDRCILDPRFTICGRETHGTFVLFLLRANSADELLQAVRDIAGDNTVTCAIINSTGPEDP